jgi:hypothetical protein
MIEKLNLFHTPLSWKELQDWVDLHAREDRVHLITAAAMGWNLACELSQSEQKDNKND